MSKKLKEPTTKEWVDIIKDMKTCLSFGESLKCYGHAHDTYTRLLDRYNNGERTRELFDEMMRMNLMKNPDERKIK